MADRELKSKVMTLGNKLAPRMGGDRLASYAPAQVRAFIAPATLQTLPAVQVVGDAVKGLRLRFTV
jgi:hypothetical protein